MSGTFSPREIERMAFEARAEKLPLTPAMRRALRRDRKRWLALYGVIATLFAAFAVGFAIWLAQPSTAASDTSDAPLVFVVLAVVEVIVVYTAITKVSRLDRDAHGGVFLRMTGNLAPLEPVAQAQGAWIPVRSSAFRYIQVDDVKIVALTAVAEAIEHLDYGTVDLSRYDHEVIEVRDREGKVVYRMRGYAPDTSEG